MPIGAGARTATPHLDAEASVEQANHEIVMNSMDVEREKRFIMWSGVIFFMILIGFFWIYNSKKIFLASRLENNSAATQNKTWQELTNEISEKLNDFKTDLKKIDEFIEEPSTTAIANTEKQERNIFELPQSPSSTEEFSTTSLETLDMLKEKLEELNNN